MSTPSQTEKPTIPINKYSVHEAKSMIDQTIIEVCPNNFDIKF